MNPTPKTLFARACATGDLAAVEAGLAAGASLGPLNPKGLTPLHLAALTGGSPEVVQALVDAGADVHARVTAPIARFSTYVGARRVGGRGLAGPDTPLHAALRSLGNSFWGTSTVIAEIAGILLGAGADPNAVGGSGTPPLVHAAHQRTPAAADVIRSLLAAGADREAASHGTSPLFAAVSFRNRPAVEALLAAGADPCRPEIAAPNVVAGSTPLHMAVIMCDDDVFRLVLDAAGEVDVKDSNGGTPLHIASRLDGPHTVRMLLKAGADPRARLDEPFDHFGRPADNPLDLARVRNLDRVVAVIEKYLR